MTVNHELKFIAKSTFFHTLGLIKPFFQNNVRKFGNGIWDWRPTKYYNY